MAHRRQEKDQNKKLQVIKERQALAKLAQSGKCLFNQDVDCKSQDKMKRDCAKCDLFPMDEYNKALMMKARKKTLRQKILRGDKL